MNRTNNLFIPLILTLALLFTMLSFTTALAGTKSKSSDIGSKAAALNGKVAKDNDAHCGLCLDDASGTKI